MVDRQVFGEVGKDYKQLTNILTKGCKISINATGKTIRDPTFVEFLKDIKQQYRFNDDYPVWIEITEQNTTGLDPKEFKHRLQQIKSYGYKLALDDFSVGFSSMNYIKTGCFDLVKLDGSLVTGIETDSKSMDIISSIMQLSRSMGFKVLAEFVEKEEQQKLLEKIGCTEYQGHLYSKAVPIEKLKPSFSRNN